MTSDTDHGSDPQPGNLREQAVSGVVWTTIEKWTVRLSTLVGFVILGNLLSPEDFGVVALAMTFIGFLTTLSDAGLAAYVMQKKRLTAATTHTAFFTTSALAVLLAVTLTLLAGPISRAFDVPELRSVLPALAVALLVAGMSTVPAVLLARELRFKQLALRQILSAGISILVAVPLALAGAGVWALVAQTITRTVVSFVALWATSDYRPRWQFDRPEARAMTVYGAKALPAQLQVQIRAQGEVFLIGVLAGTVALGYWSVAGRLVRVIAEVFSSVVGTVAHPVFARLQDNRERLSRALATTRGLTALVLVPALVLLALVSEQVVPAVFGEQWEPTTTIAAFLALAMLLQSLTNFDRSALLATGHPGPELVVTSVLMVVQLGVVALLYWDLELVAAAIALATGLSLPVRVLIVRRLLGVPLSAMRDTLTVLLAGGLATAAVLGAQAALHLDGGAYVVLATALGAVVYGGVVLLLARPLVAEAVSLLRSVAARLSRKRGARASAPAGAGG